MLGVAVRDRSTGGSCGGARIMEIVRSTYSLKAELPTPDCGGIGALGITMGWLCAADDEGALNDGGP